MQTVTFLFTDIAGSTALLRRVGEGVYAQLLGDDQWLAEALTGLAGSCYESRDFHRGRVLAAEALEHARLVGDDVLLAESFYVQLVFAQALDDDAAARLSAEALSCERRSGDHFTMYAIAGTLSNRALNNGGLRAAREHVEQAMRAIESFGGDGYFMTGQLGSVLRQEGDPVGTQSAFADERTGLSWQELEDGYRRESIDQVRAALGAAEFDQAYAEGGGLNFGTAFALALQSATPGALSESGAAAPPAAATPAL